MSKNPNLHLVEKFYQALSESDAALFWGIQTDDVIYNISGQTVISGRIQGKKNMSDDITPYVFGGLQMDNFRFSKKWKVMCSDERRIVVIMEADGLATNGVRYDQRYVHIFEFRDSLISAVWEFFDTQLANDALFHAAANVPRSPNFTAFEF